jgi:plastocyanin
MHAASGPCRSNPRVRAASFLRTLAALGLVAALAACSGTGERPAGTRTAEPFGRGAAITVVARNTAFDVGELVLPAGLPVALTLDNRDGALHNLSIFPSADGPEGAPLLSFDPFGGPAEQTHTVDPLQAGTYSFHCDLHPQMQGAVVVR